MTTESTNNNPTNTRKPLGFGMTMLASAVGVIVAFAVLQFLGFLIFIGMLVSLISSSGKTVTTLTGTNYAVELDLRGGITESVGTELQELMSRDKSVSMEEMLKAIDCAATDDRVVALYLHMGGGTMDWAQAEELMIALQDFDSECGKPIFAYGDAYSQPEYYVATAARTIAVHPAGMIDFRGMGGQIIFYKGLLDKLGVKIDLIRPSSNAYKSAGESYIRTDMSDENRQQVREYISGIWNHCIETIAENRNHTIDIFYDLQGRKITITPEDLNALADNLTACLPHEAKKAWLVDTLCFEQDIKQLMKENYHAKKIVGVKTYAKEWDYNEGNHGIAVIYAEGNVLPGTSDGRDVAVYGDDIAKALKDAAMDDDVKAIVLRINSPGGAATASETMTYAMKSVRGRKPIVVSMSGVAASAGYEMACMADCIVAHPTTLTGSIGVFATIPEISDLLRKHLGITTDTVQTNRNSTGLTITRPLSPAARDMMQRNVEDFYKTFCQRVAFGRNMKVDEVEKLARGRVYTGAQAKELGLVDTLGGMTLALNIAAERAHLDIKDCYIVKYPEEKSLWEQIMDAYYDRDEEKEIRARLDAIIPFYSDLEAWSKMEPLQARLPFILRIEN
ncbi:MAG: signal peptide peptidase SppA [Bacteroidales bacterium]|nr:signal peptide peptidase SppA [Bacteroidales bacterium]